MKRNLWKLWPLLVALISFGIGSAFFAWFEIEGESRLLVPNEDSDLNSIYWMVWGGVISYFIGMSIVMHIVGKGIVARLFPERFQREKSD